MSDLKYALVDLSEFLKASSLNDYLYNQITVSNWQLNRLVCVEYLGIGVTGINLSTPSTLDDPFIMFVNGSAYIQDNLVVNKNMYIYGNISIAGNADLATLNVSNFNVYNKAFIKNIDISNASTINLNTENMSVNNLSIYTTFISNCDASLNKKLYVQDDSIFYNNVSINKNINILGNASINSLNITNSANFNTNISVPLLTVTNNASILNISTYNLNVATKAIINTLNVTNLNVSINANISTINISNASLINLSVSNNTTIHELVVNTSTTLIGGATVTGQLNSNNLVSTNTSLNGALTINADTSVFGNAIYKNATIKIGSNNTTWTNSSSLLDVRGQTYIDRLIVGTIITNSPVQQANVSIASNLNNNQFSIVNNSPTTLDCYCYIGEPLTPIYFTSYLFGDFNLGISQRNVPYSSSIISTFNIKAKSSTLPSPMSSLNDISNNGIIYEGPIQIGNTSSSFFNINSKGLINFDGSLNIGVNDPTLLNISSYGNINLYKNVSFVTTLDIDASSISQGIKYRGKLDVSGNFCLDGNINLTGNVYSRSDIKIKNNLSKLENVITKIQNLTGYKYTRTDLTNISKIHIGLIAQEVEKEYPEIISEENGIKTINYTSMIAILLESIKELKKEINELRVK